MAGITANRGRLDRILFTVIPSALAVLVWLPPCLGLLFFFLFRGSLFHPHALDRLLPTGIPALVSTLVCLGLASFCFRQGSRRVQTLVFGGVCALWGLMCLDLVFRFILRDPKTALWLIRLDHGFLVMQVGLCTHLFHSFTGSSRRLVRLAYAISLIYLPLTRSHLYLTGVTVYPWGMAASRGILFDVLIVLALSTVLSGCVILIRNLRRMPSRAGDGRRGRNAVVLAGGLAMAACGLSNLPAMIGYDVFPFGSFMGLPVMILAYGVFRYDVVRINLYSRRRLWHGVVIGLTWGGYALLAAAVGITVRTVPLDMAAARVVPAGLPLLLSLSVCVFFSVLSLRVDPSLVGSRLFGLICLVFAFLSTDILLNSLVTDAETGLRISRLNHAFLVMWPGLYIHLVSLVCKRPDVRPLVLFYYILGAVFAPLTQSPWYLSGTVRYSWGFFAQRGPLFDLFCLLSVLNFLYCLGLFAEARRREIRAVDRQRLTLFALGLGALGLFAVGNLPAMNGYDLYPAGNFAFVPISLFGYAMFRKNLKDVRVLLSQSVYLIGILGFLVPAAGLAGRHDFRTWSRGSILWALGFGLVMFAVYKRVLVRFLALVLRRQDRALDRWYERLTDRLSRARSLTDVVGFLADPLFQGLGVFRYLVVIDDPGSSGLRFFEENHPDARAGGGSPMGRLFPQRLSDHPLRPLIDSRGRVITQSVLEAWVADGNLTLGPDDPIRTADVIQPVHSDAALIGLILFYGKEDGSVYSLRETEFIGRMGLILGPCIENALRLEGLETEIDRRTRDLKGALDEITRIHRFIRDANASLNPDDILGVLARNLPSGFPLDTLLMLMVDGPMDRLSVSAVHSREADPERTRRLMALSVSLDDLSSWAVGCVRSGKPVCRRADEEQPVFESAVHGLVPFTTMLIFPMELGRDVIGVIVFLSDPRPFEASAADMDRLQGDVARVASAVNNARLYERAEAAARAKSEFLARMSHEIRSPLTAVLGMGELLAGTPLSDHQARCVDILTSAGGLLLSVINDILDYSRLEAGRVTLEVLDFDLHRLMEDLTGIVGISAGKKGLTVSLIRSDDLPRRVKGDPFKLAQVIMNLLDNAVRFTETGGVTLYGAPVGDDRVRLAVEDTGIGMTAEQMAVIFDRFTQAESSTTRRFGGTGLGLSISRKLAERMGGTLCVTSQPGQGSRFEMTVPLPAAGDGAVDAVPVIHAERFRLKSAFAESLPAMPEPLSPNAAARRILLAEDLATNVQVVRLFLESLPVRLDVARNGAEALSMVQKERYDLVLMDIHMPVMDGEDALRHIRDWERREGHPPVRVAALTAQGPDETGRRFLAGFDALLPKPFSRSDLLRVLGFDDRPASSEPAAGVTAVDPRFLPLLPELIAEITEALDTMARALGDADFSTILRLAHGFKGAAANMGLTALSDRFRMLHAQGLARRPDLIRAAFDAIRSDLSDLNATFL
ncbi:hypothetical protein JCM14469_33660 [Desulfatiferula olefinivorans]